MSEPNTQEPADEANAAKAADAKKSADDPLLAALRQLPARSMDGAMDARMQREARAAFSRSFEGGGWHGSAASLIGRAAVPVFLAGIVGLYMTWAIATATALVQ